MSRHLISPEGQVKLKAEISSLESDRPALSEAIAIAREHGDLSENAEYHEAKNKQGMVEAQIAHLRSILKESLVIDPKKVKKDGKVRFSSKVTVKGEDKATKEWTITGTYESDPVNGLLASNSPLGMVLLGKEVGDKCSFEAEKGKFVYEILAIS